MVNPMIDILFRSNDVFDAVSSVCHFCERGLDKTCPHTSASFQTPDQEGKTGENRLTILSTCNIM